MSTERRLKSVKWDDAMIRKLEKYIKAAPTKFDAAEQLNVSRQTLDRIIGLKSSSPETLETIKKVIL